MLRALPRSTPPPTSELFLSHTSHRRPALGSICVSVALFFLPD